MSTRAALLGGAFVVGTIDLVDALVFFGLRGVRPIRIPQSIAAGLLGRSAFDGGAMAAALGVALHYFIAFLIVATFMLISRAMPFLLRRPIVTGLVYGIGVYFVMNLIVVPLSAASAGKLVMGPVLVNGLLVHAFGVGLPSAAFARAASGLPGRDGRSP